MKKKDWLRITIAAITVAAVVMAFMIAFQGELRRIVEEETDKTILEATEKSATALREKINGDLDMIRGMALIIGDIGTFDADHWIDVLTDHPLFQEFERLGFVTPDGRGYSRKVYNINLADRDYVKEALAGRAYISDVIIDRTFQKPTIYYSAPVRSNGEILGAIALGIYTEDYGGSIHLTSLGGEGESYVIDGAGKVILQSQKTYSTHDLFIIFEKLAITAQDQEAIQQNMKDGIGGKLVYSTGQDHSHVFYQPLGIKNWYLLTVVPESLMAEKTASITRIVNLLGIAALLTLFGFFSYVEWVRSRHRKALERMAYVDELTGIMNKNSFKIQGEQLIDRSQETYAFVLLDIDRFKLINDQFGYEQGNALLKFIASKISKLVGPEERCARFQADRFGMLLEFHGNEALESRLRQLIQDLSDYEFPGETHLNLVYCLGIKIVEDKNLPIETIADRAAFAASKVKGKHISDLAYYDDSIRSQLLDESEMEREMKAALQNGEFQVYLQPKIDLVTERITGAEALVRWQHPVKGLIPPGRFIPLFERSGLVVDLDIYMLDQICRLQKRWQEEGKHLYPISVNQSQLHLYNPVYHETVIRLIETHGVDPRYIELELTESVFYAEVEFLNKVMKILRNKGFLVSIDDFGSGYSSLNMLKDIEVDVLKLDGAFLRVNADQERSEKIIETVVTMASELGMKSLAEGVETEQQVRFLQRIGCNQAQGYYYHKPMPATDYEQLVYGGQ